MRPIMLSCAVCAAIWALAPTAKAEDTLFRCVDRHGVQLLTDRPCETLLAPTRQLPEKEHFVLPSSEQSRNHWVNKAPARVPPKIDVETLRVARQALELRDKVASAR